MSRALAVSLLFVAACLRPNEGLIRILCTPADPCPDGQSCVEGTCQATLSDGGSAADQRTSPADLKAAGCAKGTGTAVGADAWACPGAFTTGQAAAQCASGYSFCTMGTQIDLATAANLSGFFAADVPAYWSGTKDNELCVSALGNQLLYGVGQGGRAGTKRCNGFPTVIDVFNGAWTTTNGSLAVASNTAAGDGVLCCR